MAHSTGSFARDSRDEARARRARFAKRLRVTAASFPADTSLTRCSGGGCGTACGLRSSGWTSAGGRRASGRETGGAGATPSDEHVGTQALQLGPHPPLDERGQVTVEPLFGRKAYLVSL